MLKKPLVLLLITIVAISIGIQFVLRSEWISEKLIQVTTDRVEKILGGKASLNRARLNLTPTFVEYDEFSLRETPGDSRVVRVEKIRVSLSLFSLLTDVLFIKQISLFNPDLHLTKGEFPLNASFSRRGKPPSSKGPGKPTLVIREIKIHNGKIGYELPEKSIMVSSNRINLTIKPSLKMDRFDTFLSAREVVWARAEAKRKIEEFSARGEVKADQVEIENLEFSSLGSSFTGRGRIQNFLKPEIALTADVSIPFEGLHPIFPEMTPFLGNLRISGDFSGVWPDISIGGNIAGFGLSFKDSRIGGVQAAFFYKSRKVSLSNINSSIFGGKASGEARFSFEKLQYPDERNPFSLSLDVREISLGELLTAFGKNSGDTRFRATGRIEAEGGYSSMGIDFDTVSGKGDLGFRKIEAVPAIDPAGTAPNPNPRIFSGLLSFVREGTARFEIQEGLIFVQEGNISTPQTSVSFEGEIEKTGDLRLDVDLATREMAELMDPLVPNLLRGELNLAGRLTGTPDNPVFNGTGKTRDLFIRGQHFDTGESGILYKNLALRFTQGILTRDDSRYQVSGELGFNHPRGSRPSFDFDARVTRGSPHHIIPIFTNDLPVVISVTGKISAKGNPKEFKVRGNLKFGEGEIYGQPLDSGELGLEITRDQISFKKTTARLGNSVVKGEGIIRFSKNFEFSAHSDSVELRDIAPVKNHLAFLEGPVSGSFVGRGTFNNPVFEADLKLRDVVLTGHPLGPGIVKGTFENQLLNATGALDAGLTGRARLKWEEGFPFEFDLGFNKMNFLSWFASSIPGLTNLLHLKSTGTVTGKGRFVTPPPGMSPAKDKLPVDMRAEVALERLSAGFKDYILVNRSPVNLKLQGEKATIESFEFQGQGTSLTVSGSLDFFKRYDILLNGEADLNLLRTFTEEFSYGKGQGKLALQVTGPWENPEFRGSLSVRDGTLKSETLGQSLAIHLLGLKFSEHKMILEEFEAGFGGGIVQATGSIDLVGFIPNKFVLKMGAENVLVKPFEGLSMTLDADFDFSGNTESQLLLGELRIQSASYKRRIDFKTWVREVFTEDQRPPPSSPLLRNVSLQVSISGSENIGIENNLAQILLEADLGVRGTLDRPQFGGQIAAREGKFSFQDSEFTIQNGVVDIGTGGTTKTTAVIDLQATTRIRNYDIELSLVGPLNRSELTFTTNPPLKDQNEIFCLLISKKPCEELREASREYGTAQASKWVSDEIENLISDKVGELPADLNVDTSAISFRKTFLDDKLQVTYASSFDATKEPEVFLEYFVSNNISLFGASDEEGKVGADLKFHLEFR